MRARITFTKTGALRYVGHLDLQTLWERAARRAGLPLAYSRGFHPQARIQFAAALPLGFSSRAEVMDMRLESDVPASELPGRLREALPAGIAVMDVQAVAENEPALQTQVLSAEYEVTLLEGMDTGGLEQAIQRVLGAPSLPRERRGKAYDLRPLIEDLDMLAEAQREPGTVIRMRLAAREGATGRPEEVLAELHVPTQNARIERSRLIFRT